MAILVINAGSSSVKFTLFGPDAQTPDVGRQRRQPTKAQATDPRHAGGADVAAAVPTRVGRGKGARQENAPGMEPQR